MSAGEEAVLAAALVHVIPITTAFRFLYLLDLPTLLGRQGLHFVVHLISLVVHRCRSRPPGVGLLAIVFEILILGVP